jgi:hypothetical protein
VTTTVRPLWSGICSAVHLLLTAASVSQRERTNPFNPR